MIEKTRRERLTEAMFHDIKATAWALMKEHGTAGLSIRAISRELNISAPAIYHYFRNLDELTTALIIDAFKAYAQAMWDARAAALAEQVAPAEQFLRLAEAGWRWAIENPIRFQLIYGNPIPGYVAPSEVITPLAQAVGLAGMEATLEILRRGDVVIPADMREIGPGVREQYILKLGTDDEQHLIAYQLINTAWTTIFGLAMLQINGHLSPVVGDSESFFRQQIRFLLRNLGLSV